MHCEKTFSYVGRSTSNTLNHLYRTHSKQLKPVMDSKKNPSYTYGLKCAIVKKALTGIKKLFQVSYK